VRASLDNAAIRSATVRIPDAADNGVEARVYRPDHCRPSRSDKDEQRRSLVSLPAARAERTPVMPTIAALVAYGDNFARAALHVLLDDELDISVLGSAGDGGEALALAEQTQPDIMLIDIALPGLDAVELTRRLACERSGSECRVLILSASEQDEEVFTSLRAGASGFLVKDTDPSGLLGAVRTVAAGAGVLSPRVARRLISELASRPDPLLWHHDQLEELTPREREVMALVGTGLSNEEIATHLVVTPATARTHVSRVLGKVRVRDRAQLVALAYETGLVVAKNAGAARESVLPPKLTRHRLDPTLAQARARPLRASQPEHSVSSLEQRVRHGAADVSRCAREEELHRRLPPALGAGNAAALS
jgi:DNA-binding NarL/FixJ family response regulator